MVHLAGKQCYGISLIEYLEKVDNCKPVGSVFLCVVDTEVKPLGVFVGVQVITKPQFIVIFITATNMPYNRVTHCGPFP